jgi:AraC family transcriptional regulator
MKNLKTGQFYGITNETIRLCGITLTDTEYTHDKVDWHFHENAYLTFIIEGKLIEGNKKNIYTCGAGTLLFHNWQEAHYNIKPDGFTRGFHIELEQKWFDSYGIQSDALSGISDLSSPGFRSIMYNIFKESKLSDKMGQLSIDTLLIELFKSMSGIKVTSDKKKPKWVDKIKSVINDTEEDLTLTDLALLINVHPVHLCREFKKYFHSSLSDYIRTTRVQKALALMSDPDRSLTSIALQCNFADQSHFIRSFKTLYNITPLTYRKLLLKNQRS